MKRPILKRVLRIGVGAVALLFFTATGALAQAEGRITGRVTDLQTGRPLAGAQVFLPGTQQGSLSNESGQYLILRVPAGEHVVRVQMLGYAQAEETITLEAGGSAVVDFQLSQIAISLDQIVVTGAGVQTERRKLGNTIATVDVASLEAAPVMNVSDMLQGREPGVVGLPGGGLVGQGTRIRIRGSASLSQSNEPIVYIDGVRMDNSGGYRGSRLNDINPEAIERIEILKGAAAATLYGTEASNGVIQIFTRKGATGEPQWSVKLDQSFSSYPESQIKPNSGFARTQDQATRLSQLFGRTIQPYVPFSVPMVKRVFETGRQTAISGSVTGGAEGLSYYLSGRWQDQNGPMGGENLGPVRDTESHKQVTMNLSLTPTEKLQFLTSANYAHVITEGPNAGNSIYSPISVSLYSKPENAVCFSEMLGNGECAGPGNPTGAPTFGTVRETLYRQYTGDTERFTGSLKAGYQLQPDLRLEATLGVDWVDERNEGITPYGYNVDGISTSDTLGARSVTARRHKEISVDVKGNWNRNLGEDFSSSLVFGGQGFFTTTESSGGNANIFPGPGINVVSAGQNRDVNENFLQVVNGGAFVQEQLGFQDYVFLTVGGRYDKNSAFGETSSGVFYPKVSLSVVPSDRPGWSGNFLSTLRIRGALGQSGLQPGAFDKFTTFSSIATDQGAGLLPDNLGNPDLKPEVSTEWELGVEGGFLQDRIGLTATYWDRSVKDALVPRQFAPSGGFSNEQLDNIGEVTGHGLELGLNAQAFTSENVSVNVFANAAYMKEEVTDLGGAPPLKAQGTYPRVRNFVIEGYAPGAMLGAKLIQPCSKRASGATYQCLESGQLPYDTNRDGIPDTAAELLAYLQSPPSRSFDDPLLNPLIVDEDGDGDYLDHYLGKPTPDWQGSVGADVSFLRNFRMNMLFEYRLGFELTDITDAFRQANAGIGRNTPRAAWAEATLMNPASTPEERLEAVKAWAYELKALSPFSGLNTIKPGDFLRWREVSLTYEVPSDLAGRLGAQGLSLTVNARNLALWTKYEGNDPELSYLPRCTDASVSCNFADGVDAYGWPIPRQFGFSVRAVF